MLRRTRTEVAGDLPPRIEEDLIVELEPLQRNLYDAELKRAGRGCSACKPRASSTPRGSTFRDRAQPGTFHL
jgi:SNF2 family DNA or RNA helicase